MNTNNNDDVLFINKPVSAVVALLFFTCAAFVAYAFVITLMEGA